MESNWSQVGAKLGNIGAKWGYLGAKLGAELSQERAKLSDVGAKSNQDEAKMRVNKEPSLERTRHHAVCILIKVALQLNIALAEAHEGISIFELLHFACLVLPRLIEHTHLFR